MPAIHGYGTCHRHGNVNSRFIKQPIILSLLRKASLQVRPLLNKLHIKVNIFFRMTCQSLEKCARSGTLIPHIQHNKWYLQNKSLVFSVACKCPSTWNSCISVEKPNNYIFYHLNWIGSAVMLNDFKFLMNLCLSGLLVWSVGFLIKTLDVDFSDLSLSERLIWLTDFQLLRL